MKTLHVADSLDIIWEIVNRANKYIDETTPWVLAKDENQKERLGTVLYNLLEGIRFISVLVSPFMPETAKAIQAQIGTTLDTYESLQSFGGMIDGNKVGTATPLFQRIDAEKMLSESEEKQKAAQAQEKAFSEIEGVAKIGIEDFMKVDLRVAKITDCEPIKKAKKLLKLTLDDGTGKPRTVASGIAKWYKPEDLIGKSVIVVSNLKPAVLCGVESQGMILAADCSEDEVKVIFVDGVPAGAQVR